MSDTRMTIKELADSLGVSKTTVRKHMDEEFRSKFTEKGENGVIYITAEGCARFAETTGNRPQTPQFTGNQFAETTENRPRTPQTSVSSDVVAVLQATIDALQKQLDVKDAQISQLTTALENTTASLQAAQALHAGTMQQQLGDGTGNGENVAEPEDVQQTGKRGGFWWWKRK